MPHNGRNGLRRVAYCFDYAVGCGRPDLERWARIEGAKVMITIDLPWLAFDLDDLPLRHMPLDAVQPDSETMLNHLHAPANTQHWKPAPLGPVKQGKFQSVAFRRIAATYCEVVPSAQHQSTNLRSCAQRQRHFDYIRKG